MRKAFLATCVSLAGFFCAATAAPAADPGSEDPNNWPQYHRTANAWRYSPLDQINKDNVSRLSVAWIAHGGDITMGIQETPLAIDGVIYSITSGNRVAALDGKTGQEIWSYEPRLNPLTKKILFDIGVGGPLAGFAVEARTHLRPNQSVAQLPPPDVSSAQTRSRRGN